MSLFGGEGEDRTIKAKKERGKKGKERREGERRGKGRGEKKAPN